MLGYDWSLKEINQARLVGRDLEGEKVMAVRRSFDEFLDEVVLYGDADHGWDGLINNTNADRVDVDDSGTGNSRLWDDKTAEQILKDINDLILGVYTSTETVEMANVLAVPPNIWSNLVSKHIPGTAVTVGQHIMANNVYTMRTQRPLMLREIRGLEKAGPGGVGRFMVYRRDRSVLKLHLPMPMMFLDPENRTALLYERIAYLRTGGLEVRRPKAVRYGDGITPVAA